LFLIVLVNCLWVQRSIDSCSNPTHRSQL